MLLQSVLHVNPIKWTRNTLLLYLYFYNKEMNNTWNVSKAINLFRSEGRAVFQDRSRWAGSSSQKSTWPSRGTGTGTGRSEHQCVCHIPKHVQGDSGSGCWPHVALGDLRCIRCQALALCSGHRAGWAPGPSVPSILCWSRMDDPKAMALKDKKALNCVAPRTFTSNKPADVYYITSTQ